MAKTISDDKYKKAVAIVEKTATPRIKKIVDEVNKFFAKDGIRAGAEVKWFFDEIGEPEAKRLTEEDEDNA